MHLKMSKLFLFLLLLLLLLLNIKQHEYVILSYCKGGKKSHLVCCDLQLNFLNVLSSKWVVLFNLDLFCVFLGNCML